MSAAQMKRQIEQIVAFGEQVMIDSWAKDEFEVTVYYLGANGPTHFHSQGRTLPEAVDRAFRRRNEMREAEHDVTPPTGLVETEEKR